MGDGLLCSSDPVDVQRYEVVDVNDYGEETRAWTTAITGVASVQPFNVSETVHERDTTTVKKRLISEDASLFDVTQYDRIVCRGETFEVNGIPEVFYFEGYADHVEMYLKRIEG